MRAVCIPYGLPGSPLRNLPPVVQRANSLGSVIGSWDAGPDEEGSLVGTEQMQNQINERRAL